MDAWLIIPLLTSKTMLVTSYLDIKLTIIPWYGMGPCCTLHRKTANFSDLAYHQLDLLNHFESQSVEVLEQLGLEHLKHQLLSVKYLLNPTKHLKIC